MRIDPPPSLARAAGTKPAATAAAEAPDDPPAERVTFQGLRVSPKAVDSVVAIAARAGKWVLPTTIAPAARTRRTTSASSLAGAP